MGVVFQIRAIRRTKNMHTVLQNYDCKVLLIVIVNVKYILIKILAACNLELKVRSV